MTSTNIRHHTHARLAHAVPGRLRVRLHERAPASLLDGLAAIRVAPGVLAVEVRRAARSVVVRYDPNDVSQIEVLEAFAVAGVLVEHVAESGAPAADSTGRVRGSVVDPGTTSRPDPYSDAEKEGGSTLRELLIGPPPKLDRRFAESLALSAVSFVGARQVGLALGGGMTLPAYFVIWLTLRRLSGMGRRR